MNALDKKVNQLFESKTKYPDYVVCEIRWCDTGEIENVTIALFPYSDKVPNKIDEQIFFYTNGISGLLELTANIDFTKDQFNNEEDFYREIEKYNTDDPLSDDWTYLHRGEDFAIIDVIEFS